MKICINSRDLTPCQKARIEEYFQDNFCFDGKKPTLIWKLDDSEFILLGYPHGNVIDCESNLEGRDLRSLMFRVHENELMEIAGRNMLRAFKGSLGACSA